MKIYKKAKRVFKGKIFDVYQWKQKMFDGSYETFEMVKRPYTVQVIAVQGNKIVLSDEQQPTKGRYLTLFGGRIDEKETPIHAAKRELLEEAGLVSNKWKLLRIEDPLQKIDWKVYYYIARDCKRISKQSLDAGEKIKVVRVSFEKFLDIASNEKFRFRDGSFSKYILRMLLNRKMLASFRKKILK